MPATEMIPIGAYNYFKKSPASSFTSNTIKDKLIKVYKMLNDYKL
jgi:hypothetical protein